MNVLKLLQQWRCNTSARNKVRCYLLVVDVSGVMTLDYVSGHFNYFVSNGHVILISVTSSEILYLSVCQSISRIIFPLVDRLQIVAVEL